MRPFYKRDIRFCLDLDLTDFFRRATPIVFCCCGLGASSVPCHAQQLKIALQYVEAHDRILPSEGVTTTNVEVDVLLDKNGKIISNTDKQSGRRAHGHEEKELQLGRNAGEEWRVAGKNKLINIVEYESYWRGVLLKIDNDSCAAEIRYTLKTGFSDYRYHRLSTGEPAVARSVTASAVRCAIIAPAG